MALSFFPFNRSGDQFEALLGPHIEALYRLAYRFTGSQHDAEDLVQELLLKLYPRRQQLTSIETLRPWLTRSLYNLYIDTIRSNERSALAKSENESDSILQTLTAPGAEPEHHAETRDRQKQLTDALNQLDEARRSLVILHDMEGYTLSELNLILEQPIGTLKSRLHRARQQLREYLEKEPFTQKQRVNG